MGFAFADDRNRQTERLPPQGRLAMASPQVPQVGHSLWLQRRSNRKAVRRVHWRGDRTPLGLLLLLVGLLILFAVFLPSNDAVEKAKQAAKTEKADSQQLPVVGVLTEP
jgi:hypothetical protein